MCYCNISSVSWYRCLCHSSGELVSRITKDTNDMSESLSEELSLLMWYSMRLVFLYGSMMLLSVRLSIFTLLGLPVIWIVPEFSGRFYQVGLKSLLSDWSDFFWFANRIENGTNGVFPVTSLDICVLQNHTSSADVLEIFKLLIKDFNHVSK